MQRFVELKGVSRRGVNPMIVIYCFLLVKSVSKLCSPEVHLDYKTSLVLEYLQQEHNLNCSKKINLSIN